MIDFRKGFCQVYINFLTVKAQNPLMKFIFLLYPVTQIQDHLFKVKATLKKIKLKFE